MKNLRILLNEKKKEQENVLSMWKNDVLALSQTKNFDEYSKKGQRKLAKIADKYADTLIEIEEEIEELEQKILDEQ